MDSLVSTEWLADQIGADDLAVVDCTLFLPNMGRDPIAEFAAAHIPGARFLDIAEVADASNPAPHSLPGAETFGAAMDRLGIAQTDRIVVYDNSPLRTAVRGWFMFKRFGAANVAILDGGLGKWISEQRPTESNEASPRSGRRFVAREAWGHVVEKSDLRGGLDVPILDARSHARFTGEDADPRPTVAAGHIPGSKSLPMSEFYNPDGTFVEPDEIRRLFAAVGVDPTRPFVASCGSGVTANTLIFAAHLLGHDSGMLYDGSWSEWGSDPTTPKELGEARL